MEALVEYNAAQTFKYEPIAESDGIRLLVLHPAENEAAEIRCSLIITTLSKYEYEVIDHYTALSYVWGDASNVKPIEVDGAQVEITANLHDALLYIRDQSRPIHLWADAICINQNDSEEKNQQVRMMGMIYATADHTIIYLRARGNDSESKDFLGDAQLPELAVEIIQNSWFTRVWVFQEMVFSKDPWVQYGRRRWKWAYVYDVLRKAIGLKQFDPISSDSSSTIPIGVIDRVSTYASEHLRLCFERITEMENTRQRHHKYEAKGTELIKLVSARRGLGVTDPRDMIFAHTGFASDGNAEVLHVDYTKQWEKVYTQFAQYQLRKDYRCRLLFHVEGSENVPTRVGLPSWVPNWRMRFMPGAQPFPALEPRSSWEPVEVPYHLQQKPMGVRFQNNFQLCLEEPPTLLLLGCRHEMVARFSVPLSFENIPLDKITSLSDMFVTIKDEYTDLEEYADGAECVDAYTDMYNAWREVIKDDEILPELEERSPDESFRRGAYGESKGPFPVFGFTDERNNDWGSAVSRNLPTRDSIADCLVAAFDPQFERSFLEGRRLARFSNGVLALVPASVQLGDVVMCTNHELGSWSREPFLLRPCPQLQDSSVDAMIKTKVLADIEASTDSGDRWRHDIEVAMTPVEHCTFIGPTFMHGLEFLEATSRFRICEQDFNDENEKECTLLPMTIYAIH